MNSSAKQGFAQLSKDFSYLLEMKQSFAEALKRFDDKDEIEPVPYMAMENTMLALDIAITNLSKLLVIANEIESGESTNDRIN
jgi:hypothetical protein